MADINLIIQNAVPWILYLFAILGAFVCLIQKDLIKMAVLTSITGFILAAIYQVFISTRCSINTSCSGSNYCTNISSSYNS